MPAANHNHRHGLAAAVAKPLRTAPVALETLRATCPLSAWDGAPGRCQWCNGSLEGLTRRSVWCSDACRRKFERNHIWRRARAAARRTGRYRCARGGCDAPREVLEVNHIVPLVGAGYGPSCAHHQVNLEVLCHAHHVQVTGEQRLARG